MIKISTNQIAKNRHTYIYFEHRKILKGLVCLPIFALTRQQLKTENNKLNIYTISYEINFWTFFSQACGTTHFICPCTILHTSGFGLPPKVEDCCMFKDVRSYVYGLYLFSNGKRPSHLELKKKSYTVPVID